MSSNISRKPGFLKEINVLDNINHGNPNHLHQEIHNNVSHSPGYLKYLEDLERSSNPKLLELPRTTRVNYMRPSIGNFNGNPGVLKKFGRNPRYN